MSLYIIYKRHLKRTYIIYIISTGHQYLWKGVQKGPTATANAVEVSRPSWVNLFIRALKSPNFPVGRLWRAKTFRTKCVNSYFATCMPKVRKLHSRHIKKYVNRSWLSENCPKNYKAIRKLSRLSENFPDCPETFQSFQKLSRLSIYSPDCPETFQTVRKLSRLSGYSPYCPEAFQTVC